MLLSTGVQAWVCVDGVRCEEFQETVSENGRDVTCWIASEAGKTFSIHWTDVPVDQTAYMLTIDGASVGGVCCKDPNGRRIENTMTGRRVAATEERPFMFAPIKQSDDESLLLNSIEGVGEIKIKTYTAHFTPTHPTYKQPDAQKTFHERMKKGVDHQTSFGEARYSPPTSGVSYIPTQIGPIYSLTFKYRPLNVLQAHGIAPPPKFVDVKPEKKPVVHDSDSEVEIIEAKPTTSVKRERKRKTSSPDPKVKTESSPQHKKVKREPVNSKNDDIIYISD
ncbi:hypothetical protein CYLTODRAFT_426459 [Cylindrobasidium torrendii FP15055 ss-10]|uniref:DUF7918 domain-containing protein n=1 Tax=Cylindrobasidium torrendii FP15055 ss-10 TaxID=1314674 RepID=A0A0D7AYF0_9AGAR|nr:hypothetical protein CYLTODRAFT_426459 [Cylindrobasidium torrendii FP15055 ss-10]